ncbi:hypothetical protein IW262DRAFT_1548771 [Armillaria fumosa]|nr:hypothetical protein IW262DRAFT_1548771 [Armillaria fumosa]
MDNNGPILSKELLQKIIDTVTEDDSATPTLTAITQTTRAMRLQAQKHIYETIRLQIPDDDYIDKLGRIHATDPTMQNLQVVSFTFLNAEGLWPFINSFASPSMAQITSLELRHVTLSFHAFNSFISSPCLTELFLAGLHIVEYESAPDIEDGTDFSAPDCSLPQLQSALSCPLKELHLDIIKSSDFMIMNLIVTSRYPIITEDSLDKVDFSSNYSEDNQVHLF